MRYRQTQTNQRLKASVIATHDYCLFQYRQIFRFKMSSSKTSYYLDRCAPDPRITQDNSRHFKAEIANLKEQNEQLNKQVECHHYRQYLQALLDAQQSQLKAQDCSANLKLKCMEIDELRYLLKGNTKQNDVKSHETTQKEFAAMLLQKNEINKLQAQWKQKTEELQGQLQLQKDLYQELKKQNQVLSSQLDEAQSEIQSLQESLKASKDREFSIEDKLNQIRSSEDQYQHLEHQIKEMQRSYNEEFSHYERIIRNVEMDNEQMQRQLYIQKQQFDEERSKAETQLRQKSELISRLKCQIEATQLPKHSSISFRLSDRRPSSLSSKSAESPKLFCTESFISNSDSDVGSTYMQDDYSENYNRNLNQQNSFHTLNRPAKDQSKSLKSSHQRSQQY